MKANIMFQQIASELNSKKYRDYAYSLTKNRDDGDDLIGDLILVAHSRLDQFKKAMDNNYLAQFLMLTIRNEFIDRTRKRNNINISEITHISQNHTGLVDTEAGKRALERLEQDSNNNSYYPLLYRSVEKFKGVKNLSKVTGIPKITLYNGLEKYKNNLKNLKKILLIANKESGVGYHRIAKPYSELRLTRDDIIVDLANFYKNSDYDIVIFNRVCGVSYADERALINEMKVCGQKVIVDVDDYWELPPGHILEQYYKKEGMTKRIAQNIREADVVTCTNEVLALKILKLNKNVVILPNALNENDLQWKDFRQPYDLYRFGYVGSRAHTTDVPILRKACNKMHSCEKGFQMKLIGFADGDKSSELFQQVMTSRLTHKEGTFARMYSQPVEKYGGAYNFLDCALAPLNDCLFNRCKSNLKILEAAAHKLPIICSKIHPYFGGDFDNCVLYAETEYDWYKQMTKLLKNPKLGEELGKQANDIFLKNYTYKQINKLRSEII